MRIALCKSSMFGPISGADELLGNYAVHLHQAGHEVSVVLLYPPALEDQYFRRLQNTGVPVTAIIHRSHLFSFLRLLRKASSLLFFLFVFKGATQGMRKIWQIAINAITRLHYPYCRAYFETARPDLLHVFTPDTGAAMMIRAGHELGIPVLYHEMGTASHLPLLTNYYRRLERFLPFCTEVAALSPRLADEWSARFPFLTSVSVLPLMIERSHATSLFPQAFNESHETVFGFAARLEEGKGPLLLVDALAMVNRERRLAVARISGMGPQLLEVKARVRELAQTNACQYVGYYSGQHGRSAFMNSIDVFVLPSFAEGTPNSIIEAMAHGLPVIASDVGGIPDIVDSDCGILVPPGDADALAEAMRLLIQDPDRRKRMGAAARQRSEKLFSPKSVIPLMLQTYGRLTGNGHELVKTKSDGGPFHPWRDIRTPPAKSIAVNDFA